MLVSGEVAADDDQVQTHAAVEVERVRGPALRVEDAKAELGLLPCRKRRLHGREVVAAPDRRQAVGAALRGGAQVGHRHVPGVRVLHRDAPVSRRRARKCRDAANEGEGGREGRKPRRGTKVTEALRHQTATS